MGLMYIYQFTFPNKSIKPFMVDLNSETLELVKPLPEKIGFGSNLSFLEFRLIIQKLFL